MKNLLGISSVLTVMTILSGTVQRTHEDVQSGNYRMTEFQAAKTSSVQPVTSIQATGVGWIYMNEPAAGVAGVWGYLYM